MNRRFPVSGSASSAWRWAAIAAFVVLVPAAHASGALAQKYACAACHQAERKAVGPAWREIAAKYADGSVTAEQLAIAIRRGGSGKWGPVPMPAQAHVAQADLLVLSRWVLEGGRP